MRKPVVDYKNFRFSKITSPEYNHLLYLSGWILYFTLYTLTELFIPSDKCFVVHHWLDDVIPFCEFFIVPYVLWYALIVVSLLYFALYNPKNFKKLQIFITATQIIAMFIYIVWPSRQDLRPTEFARDNFFTDVVGLLYTIDTNTNVFPSLHVGYSLAMMSIWVKEKSVSWYVKLFISIFCITVCLSTAFVKQHSVLDGFASIIMCAVIEVILFKDYYLNLFKKKA